MNRPRRAIIHGILLFAVACGIAGAAIVYVGDAAEWGGFCTRQGFWGTHFIDDILYAINEPYAIHIVAAVWFGYGFSGAFALSYLCAMFFPRKHGG